MEPVCQKVVIPVVPLTYRMNIHQQKKWLPLAAGGREPHTSAMLRLRTIQLCIALLSVQAFITLLSSDFTDLWFIRIPNANLESIGEG